MDTIVAALPLVAFLACPLMMGFCLFGMRKMGCSAQSTDIPADAQLPEERVAALQQQLHAVQAELHSLQNTAPQAPQVIEM